jgi:methyltransferase
MIAPGSLLLGYLVLLLAERVAELAVSTRNTRRALAAGGIEAGRGHYPGMVLFHALFLAACAVEPLLWQRTWPPAASLLALAAALLAMALRWWAVVTLGDRWSTRIVVLPGVPLVTGGPYRLLRHPNYVAVVVELLAVPLIGGAVLTATAATLGNLLLLAVRIPAEERALRAGGGGARPSRPSLPTRDVT